MPRTESAIENLREGLKKGDETLGPVGRAFRKFNAGRPTNRKVDTPLDAVALAVEQRDRLARLLKDEGVEAKVFPLLITRHIGPQLVEPLIEDTAVNEGRLWKAVQELEFTVVERGDQFTVVGLTFVVEMEGVSHVVAYTVDRTPWGQELILNKASELRVNRPARTK